MTLGQRISRYRKEANISQEELGARLNVSRQAVSKWENDLAVPDMNDLLGLARVFGISVAELTDTPEAQTADVAQTAEPSTMDTPPSPSAPPKTVFDAIIHPLNRWQFTCAMLAAALVCIGVFLAIRVSHAERTPAPDSTVTAPDLPAQEAPPQEPPSAEVSRPKTDFALLLDWTEDGEFLELGQQTEAYPFSASSLYLDGGETVVTGDNGEEIHTVGTIEHDAFRLRYSDIAADGTCFLTLLEVAQTKEVSTPRGIHVGSTKAEVVGTYGPDALVYCLKEEGGDLLCQHDYYYAYQPKDALSNSLCFYMEDGLVAGIRVENMLDLGNEAYAVTNISRFPVQKNGDPDYSDRQDIYQEPITPTRQVYIAWNQLVTNENLSAEERYAYRSQVFTGLPDMDWQEFDSLGTINEYGTTEALILWLREQTCSDPELFWVQAGCCAKGLDGAYAENYDALLAAALFQNPVGYAKQLPRAAEYDEMVEQRILGSTAYSADYFTAECASAVEKLDEVIDTNALTAAENDWAKLLRYYLANPNSGNYTAYPNTPLE